jgi:putative transcriptional regulator
MQDLDESFDLTGKLLIASPGMTDPRFANAVIFMCAHSEDGAMGLIVNMPAPEIRIESILAQLDIPIGTPQDDILIHFGGPVETGRGFVLHTADYVGGEGTMKVTRDFSMTASVEILERLATGDGPASALLMLGYSGWGPGQLESEIVQNGWLVTDALPGIVFLGDPSEKWANALRAAGIDPRVLSGAGGSA